MRVYLDNCAFNRPYDSPSQVRIVNEACAKMAIQREIAAGRVELAVSFMLYAETRRCPNAMARQSNLDFMLRYRKSYVSRTEKQSLMPLIEEIVSTGIKAADATHIACAIRSSCDYLVTTDDRMLRYHDPRIKIITPTDMVYLLGV